MMNLFGSSSYNENFVVLWYLVILLVGIKIIRENMLSLLTFQSFIFSIESNQYQPNFEKSMNW